MRDGETLASNFETSGTLPEPLRGLPANDTDDDDGKRLPKEVIVSVPGSGEFCDYAFEVTGELEELEADEDSGMAVDEVVDRWLQSTSREYGRYW